MAKLKRIEVEATVYKYFVTVESINYPYNDKGHKLHRYITFHDVERIDGVSQRDKLLWGYFPMKCSNAEGKQLNDLNLNSGDVIRFKATLKNTRHGQRFINLTDVKVIKRVEHTPIEGLLSLVNSSSHKYLNEFDYSTILDDDDVLDLYCRHTIMRVELPMGDAFLEATSEED